MRASMQHRRSTRNVGSNIFTTESNRNKVLSQANLSLLNGENHETIGEKKRRHASAYGSRAGPKSISTTFSDFLNKDSQASVKEPNKLLAEKIADTIIAS